MIDYLFEKHNCFKTCYCEGRTSNDGIELYNAYSSLSYVISAFLILNYKTKKPIFKYLLALVLTILGISSYFSHYYMNNLGNFCDNYSILLVVLIFLFYNNVNIVTLFLTIIFFVFYSILKINRLKLTFIILILFNYYISRKARLEKKTNVLFVAINIILYISVFVWAYDYIQDEYCVHWIWHILTAILFYLLFIWYLI